MSSEGELFIFTFQSSQAALGAEKELKRAGVEVELIPVPRQIASDCGFCLLVTPGPAGTEEAPPWRTALSIFPVESLWRVTEIEKAGSPKKEKHYERYS